VRHPPHERITDASPRKKGLVREDEDDEQSLDIQRQKIDEKITVMTTAAAAPL